MLFGRLLKQVFERARNVAVMLVPNMFRHDPRNFTVAIHGNYVVGQGEGQQLDCLDCILEIAVELQRVS